MVLNLCVLSIQNSAIAEKTIREFTFCLQRRALILLADMINENVKPDAYYDSRSLQWSDDANSLGVDLGLSGMRETPRRLSTISEIARNRLKEEYIPKLISTISKLQPRLGRSQSTVEHINRCFMDSNKFR